MKIGIQTWGSHGDIRPFLALADGLQLAGHQVSLVVTCVDSDCRDIASAHGVDIRVLASPVIGPEQGDKIGQTALATRDPLAQLATILRLAYEPVEAPMFEAAQALCRDADLLIGHYFMHPLQIAAEHSGRPYVSVLLSHAAVPSAFHHPIGLPAFFGKTGNRLLWWLTRVSLNRTLLHYPNRLRGQLGMPHTEDIVNKVWLSQPLTLAAISPQICERQPDWPASVRVSGFLDMPNIAAEGSVPATLAAFLEAGEAPVYMTFGSWMPKDEDNQRRTLELLTEAARLAGCRAIIQSPSWRACGFSSSERILYVSAAPHQAIFPHCSAVLHHGGAGTTQSATLAGKPSIVVAHISEQEQWGQELRRIGIAGKPVKRRNATAAALADRIKALKDSPHMTTKAQTVSAAMRRENGVVEAVKLIEQTFGRPAT